MLKQIKLCPSGCQYWNKAIIARGGDLLAYCSTFAIYFIDMRTYELVKIIVAHTQILSCIAWNCLDRTQLASVSIDHCLYVWNVHLDQPVAHLQLTNIVTMLEYNPFDANMILLLFDNGDLYTLNIELKVLAKKANFTSYRPKMVKFHPTVPNKFALGCIEGMSIYAQIASDSIMKLLMPKQKTQVEDLQ